MRFIHHCFHVVVYLAVRTNFQYNLLVTILMKRIRLLNKIVTKLLLLRPFGNLLVKYLNLLARLFHQW